VRVFCEQRIGADRQVGAVFGHDADGDPYPNGANGSTLKYQITNHTATPTATSSDVATSRQPIPID
jgi:hypothetical protein